MKRLLLALSVVATIYPSQATKFNEEWTLSIQQDKKQHSTATVRLRRAPFDVVFTGHQTMGFAVLAATSCNALERLKTSEQISAVINFGNIVVEGAPSENTYVTVNSNANIAADTVAAHVWADDKESRLHSFQELKKLPGERMVSTRRISEVSMRLDGSKMQTVQTAKFPGNEICMLVTGLPPVGYMAHVNPKLVRITFE